MTSEATLDADGFDLKNAPTRREYSSLSGTFNVTEVATSWFIGEEYSSGWGKLGTRVIMKDINGDDIEDLIICAAEAPGADNAAKAGIANIWFGKKGIPPETIDLNADEPDLRILGGSDDSALFGDIAIGDLNGDNESDLIIGNPAQPEGGKMYILWSVNLTQDTIELFRIHPLNPGGDPWGFMRTEDYTIVGGHTALQVYANYQVGNSLFADDLDNDGFDDLIFTSHGWENMTIFWGGADKWTIGADYTMIYDLTNAGFFSYDVAIGHINDNNKTDLVVGAPLRNHLSLGSNQCGAVFVYFDIGDSRGTQLMPSTQEARPIIYGDDSYDRLGRKIILEDLNHDGLDDIIVSAPDSDGPGNNRKDSGTVYIYYGGEMNKFPSTMFAWERADYMIHGVRGSQEDIPGDRIGNMYDVGDIDGDGDYDFVFGLSTNTTNDIRSVGSIIGYNGKSILVSGRKTADLKYIEPRFRFWGIDQEDQFGYQVALGDLNDDGADDIAASTPMADGPDNLRPRCGEAYLLLGSTASLGGMTIGGSGSISDTVFAGSDAIEMNFTYFNTEGTSPLDSATLILDPGREDISISINQAGVSIDNDIYRQIEIRDGTGHGSNGMRGWFNFELSMDWFVPLGDDVDVSLTVHIENGDNISRKYPDVFSVIRDVRFSGSPVLYRNGIEMVNANEWTHPDDIITFSGLKIVYDSLHGREIPEYSCRVDLRREEDPAVSAEYEGSDWMLDSTVPYAPLVNFTISMVLTIGDKPASIPINFVPKTGDPHEMNLKVDLDPPASPTNLTLLPDGREPGVYDDDNEWYVSWEGPLVKDTESGIKAYAIQINDGDSEYAMTLGGLTVSYFSDHHFEDYRYREEVPRIDSDWGYFGPNTDVIPPHSFSVRWHGWLSMEGYIEDTVTFKGTGLVKVYLNGELAMDWTDISKENSLTIPEIPVLMPFEVYYRQPGREIPSRISMMTADGYGGYSPVSSDHLYYPGRTSTISVEDGPTFSIYVRSVDWVGRTSDRIMEVGIIDKTPPLIDLTGFPSWVGDTRPELNVTIGDPMVGGYPGSGPAEEPLMYRIREGVDEGWTDWTSTGVEFEGTNAVFKPRLHPDFKGHIQLRAVDAVGNIRETSYLPLAVDVKPPEFDVLSPDLSKVQNKDVIDLVVLLRDIGGSGVNASTARWRTGAGEGNWSEWYRFNGSGIEEEIAVDGLIYIGYGTTYLQFTASDLMGNAALSDPIEVTSKEARIDDPPVPAIKSPLNGTRSIEGRRLYLDATGTTDDGYINPDYLIYTWFSDRTGYLGSGINISVYLVLGYHNITLNVFDGVPNHNISTTVRVQIIPVEENPPSDTPISDKERTYWTAVIIGAAAILLIGIGILLYMRNRNQAGKEMMIGYSDRTQDDYDYDKWLREEERKLGIRTDEE
ncbi:MAG: hypothetical protein ACMUIG_03605 [Thermoplasmatota archaeon]